MDLGSHSVQPLHFASPEGLRWYAQSPQRKKLVREAWNGISVSFLGHLCFFHQNSVSCARFDWLVETALSSILRILCLVEACWKGAGRSNREGSSSWERVYDRQWHLLIAAVPYSSVFGNHILILYQNTLSLGVCEVFLFPNVLNQGRYLVRRWRSFRTAYSGDFSKVTKLLGSSLNPWLGVRCVFYQLAWRALCIVHIVCWPWCWWGTPHFPVSLPPPCLFRMLSRVYLSLPTALWDLVDNLLNHFVYRWFRGVINLHRVPQPKLEKRSTPEPWPWPSLLQSISLEVSHLLQQLVLKPEGTLKVIYLILFYTQRNGVQKHIRDLPNQRQVVK